MSPLTDETRGTLIAHADDVAHSLSEKWGRAVVGDPKYDEVRGWHIRVIGLLGDNEIDTVLISSDGARELVR